jgi:WD40 repeat protein
MVACFKHPSFALCFLGAIALPCGSVTSVRGLAWESRVFGQDVTYESIRFFDKNSKPLKLNSCVVSPDGRYLAANLGESAGFSIVDIPAMELVGRYGGWSYFALAFSPDSHRVLGIGGYAGSNLLDLASRNIRKLSLDESPGHVGIVLESKNGKLLVAGLQEGSAASADGTIQVGDELIAINRGRKPTLFDDEDAWSSLVGRSVADAGKAITGPPGTWIRLRHLRKGSSKPLEAALQRRWPDRVVRPRVESSRSLCKAVNRGAFVFRAAPSGAEYAYLMLQDVEARGQGDTSPDGEYFSFVGRTRKGRKFAVEVHGLYEGAIKASLPFSQSNYCELHFSADSRKVLVGTRDSIEVLDVDSANWESPVPLVPAGERDGGKVVSRRIPLGLGFPGDLYTTVPEVVYSKPAALTAFASSATGLVAVASEQGDVVLFDLPSRARIGQIGDKVLGAPAEFVDFTPNGKHLVAFAKGVLHIFSVDGLIKNGSLKAKAIVTASYLPALKGAQELKSGPSGTAARQ